LTGTIVNSLAIIAGTVIGILFKRGIPENYKITIMQGVSLAVVIIGIKNALGSDNFLIVILSIALGSIIGEFLKIEYNLEKFGLFLEKKIQGKINNADGLFAKGFVTATLVFCVGAMAIVGSLESGLSGNNQTLFAKSMLDGIGSVIFASIMGVGVAFSAVAVFIYQGLITLSAGFIKPFLIETVITQMSATGGILIMGIGFNLSGIAKIKVGNMLPAVFIPLLYYMMQLMMGW
jgi:uncharacterized protein